jgi:putative intracellular protease/amidase
MRILIVLTSHSQRGDTDQKTGFWLSEFADPYYVFVNAGAEVTLASPNGGQPPIDPSSEAPVRQTDATRRFNADAGAGDLMANTRRLDTLNPDEFDAVFFPGGHGPVWDLSEDKSVIALIEAMSVAQKPIGAVCHGVAVLRHPKTADGAPLVRGRNVAGFSNTEEDATGFTKVVPYLVEDMLKSNGGVYGRADDWASFVAVDGNLVTGQNPASSRGVAEQMLKLATVEAS